MAITHTITIGKKKKSYKGKDYTPEEKQAYFEQKMKEMSDAKLEFVKKLIEYAESKEHFPWEEPNFVKLPKSMAKLKDLEAYNAKNPDHPKPRSEANYRGMNTLILCEAMDAKGYKDSRWMTWNQVWKLNQEAVKKYEAERKAELKAQKENNSTEPVREPLTGPLISIKKEDNIGTKIWVVNPEGHDKWAINPKTRKWEQVFKRNKETGEFLLDKNGKKIPEKSPTWSMRTVFNVEQVKGLHLEPEPPMKELDTKNKCPEMETIIAHSEAKVIHDQYSGDGRYYSPMRDEVHLPPVKQFKTMSAYYATAAHEIGHSTGHPNRLNRDMGGSFGTASYAREELVAELTSVFLSQELDIKIPQKEMTNHAEYIRGWDTKVKTLKENPEELVKVINDAQKATSYIKEHMLERYRDKDKKEEIEKEPKKEKPKAKGIQRKASSKALSR